MSTLSVKKNERLCNSNVVFVDRKENRIILERFVQQRFHQQYQANIHSFARHMVALVDRANCPKAVIGYQAASEGKLFLEQYLQAPVEDVLLRTVKNSIRGTDTSEIERSEILEVGNLASDSSGTTRRLILTLIQHFYQRGYRWLVLTATPRVLNSFYKLGLGLEMLPIAIARPECLSKSSDDWGSYYDHHPAVIAGRIENGLNLLRDNRVLRSLVESAPSPIFDDQLMISGSGITISPNMSSTLHEK